MKYCCCYLNYLKKCESSPVLLHQGSKEEIQIPLMESFGIEGIERHCHSLLKNETEHFHYSWRLLFKTYKRWVHLKWQHIFAIKMRRYVKISALTIKTKQTFPLYSEQNNWENISEKVNKYRVIYSVLVLISPGYFIYSLNLVDLSSDSTCVLGRSYLSFYSYTLIH